MTFDRLTELLGKHLDDELENAKELSKLYRRLDELQINAVYKLRALIKAIERELASQDEKEPPL